MVNINELPRLEAVQQTGHRLVNSKFPPINLFDDVASEDEFEIAYAMQALVNPRVQTEVGNLSLLSRSEIPFGIAGCSYATAPFTHVNPQGSRFSDGRYGVLYFADSTETAIAEVTHHQRVYWSNVPELKFDRFVFRGLKGEFETIEIADATAIPAEDAIYAPDSYHASRTLGNELRASGSTGLQYHSVRNPGAQCWGLFTPRHVKQIIQTAHYEMIWTGPDANVEVCRLNSV